MSSDIIDGAIGNDPVGRKVENSNEMISKLRKCKVSGWLDGKTTLHFMY